MAVRGGTGTLASGAPASQPPASHRSATPPFVAHAQGLDRVRSPLGLLRPNPELPCETQEAGSVCPVAPLHEIEARLADRIVRPGDYKEGGKRGEIWRTSAISTLAGAGFERGEKTRGQVGVPHAGRRLERGHRTRDDSGVAQDIALNRDVHVPDATGPGEGLLAGEIRGGSGTQHGDAVLPVAQARHQTVRIVGRSGDRGEDLGRGLTCA